MKLLEQYRAACEVRRLAKRTIQTYCRWVEEFLRFHHNRTGHWIHPREMGDKEVEAFLTHLAVNRRLVGKIDCVVVYKVDRLSRSLLDFAKMMEVFEQHGVSFVSAGWLWSNRRRGRWIPDWSFPAIWPQESRLPQLQLK